MNDDDNRYHTGRTRTVSDCRTELAADEPCEVHAAVRSSDYGLRFDIQCECANCQAEIFLEDIAAREGDLGCVPERNTFTFSGEGYPA